MSQSNSFKPWLTATLLIFLLFPMSATAKKIWVATNGNDGYNGTDSLPYRTISHALLMASASVLDTVMVKPGTYTESVRCSTKAVVLKSLEGAQATIIDGGLKATPVVFPPATPSTTVLDGFTIMHGVPRGIYVYGYAVVVGPGLIITPSSPEIKNCRIKLNGGSSSGAGIRLEYSRSNIHHNVIDSNSTAANGGGIYAYYSSALIWNNRIEDNICTVEGSGGGISVYNRIDASSRMLIQNNLILGNTVMYSGGGVSINSSAVVFVNNLVYGNQGGAGSEGGGIETNYSDDTLYNNIVVNNEPYGISCYGGPIFFNNSFYGNTPETQPAPASCYLDISNLQGIDPRFVDAVRGDFHLQATSELLGRGRTLPGGSKSVDYDDFPRTYSTIDMGPYERRPCSLVPSFTAPPTLCVDQPIAFTNLTLGYYTLSIWSYGNGVIDTFTNLTGITPVAVYPEPATYTVTATWLCPYDIPQMATQTITVADKPKSDFQFGERSGCAPDTVGIVNLSSGTSRTDWWFFGDGDSSNAANPVHVFEKPGSYTVRLLSSNACGRDSAKSTITVSDVSQAAIEATPRAGSPLLFVSFTGSGTSSPTGWSWSFGDDSTSTLQNPLHTYFVPGRYDVSLTATNACGAGPTTTLRQFITVYGFELRPVSVDTSDLLAQKFRVAVDSLYGPFDRKIALGAYWTPKPKRGTIAVNFSEDTVNVLDVFTAEARLSKDVTAGSYQLAVVGTSISHTPVDTVLFPFVSRPKPLIQLSTNAVDFDSVQLDTVKIDSLRVTNNSFFADNLFLQVLKVVSTDSQFLPLDTSSAPLDPNKSFYIRIKFTPGSLGPKSGVLSITSDDPATPNVPVNLRAIVIPERRPPTVVATTPESGASMVLIGAFVDLEMSELIDPASFSPSLLTVRSRRLQSDIPGTARLLEQFIVSFTPSGRYPAYDTVVVRLVGMLKDRAGNTLDGNYNGKGEGTPADDFGFWFVTGPAVYPGDCNNDGVVNEIDVLPLGVFYGMTGPRRDSLGENTSWGAKQAVEWSDPRVTYADADGNGIVDVNDLMIIALNWSSAHARGSPTLPIDFDLSPYEDGFARLRESLEALSGSESGNRMLQIVNSATESSPLPDKYTLSQNHPNPFNPMTRIDYAIPRDAAVRLTIHNVLGQTVKTLVDGFERAGFKHVFWDGTDRWGRSVSSGVYFYRMESEGFREIRKMIKIQ